jgi:tetratricopeptide (TPR) repeat protein
MGRDVGSALSANQLKTNNPSYLHTLGCVYTLAGKTKEARDVLLQALDLGGLDQPSGDFWYAFGRLAEEYGEREVAIHDYEKVSAPGEMLSEPLSTYRLAQNRLHALEDVAVAIRPEVGSVAK